MTVTPSSLPNFTLIIPAAGKGLRFGADCPKQHLKLQGKAILQHTVDVFQNMQECTSIYIAIGPQDAEQHHDTLKELKNVRFTTGGKERKDSVYNTLKEISDKKHEDIILVHDAARPCVRPQDIRSLLAAMTTERAATLATPVSSTLRQTNDEGYAGPVVPRDNLYAIQTPQAFHYTDLINAHENSATNFNHTDDTQLVSAIGIDVKLVHGSSNNIKITTAGDLKLAENLIKEHLIT